MKVAILFEYSGKVRDAYTRAGHDAISVDILPTESTGNHYHGDVWNFVKEYPLHQFDLVIAHPPCTRLCNSGVLRLYIGGKKRNGIDPFKWADMEKAATEFKILYEIIHRGVIENPVMHGHAMKIIGIKPKQSIQPYEFGEDASKRTCFWIKGDLPKLKGNEYFPPRIVDSKKRWGNQTDSGQNRLGPSETRGKDRAKTYDKVAEAMSQQWI